MAFNDKRIDGLSGCRENSQRLHRIAERSGMNPEPVSVNRIPDNEPGIGGGEVFQDPQLRGGAPSCRKKPRQIRG